ncbi:DUF1272 domain-containing protein [Pseudomonas sp. JBR1]|nr:DUF1272 domain-containing protein [Pseudomonas sp. JBR1]WCE10855.1 DUF1272 domain-containing protein [Pseudomonas sp. JBR1]
MRTSCEHCAKALSMESKGAVICSYECTFCVACAAGPLQEQCPNCRGELVRRPRRRAKEAQDT